MRHEKTKNLGQMHCIVSASWGRPLERPNRSPFFLDHRYVRLSFPEQEAPSSKKRLRAAFSPNPPCA
ncbi:Protein of unknown function [Gryllus bimaculatus]|nr:Protein of unknown function [Gryllus bimaculatus]